MRLLIAVSDHGFGHATRTIALLRAVLAIEPALEAELVSGPKAARLLSRSFEEDPRVSVRVRPSDPGLVLFPGTLRVDSAATRTAWRAWASSWEVWAREEAAAAGGLRRPDAVLADGSPPALLAAERLGVPGLLLGNFAWTDLLAPHLGPELDTVRKVLGRASASFCYPFRLPFDGAPPPRPLPLVARRPRRSRAGVRRCLGVGDGERLIYISSGQSSSPRELWQMAEELGAKLLIAWDAPEVPGAARIPAEDTEGQEYIAASDLVFGKVGYGTLSEALVGGVPMVMLLVEGTPETVPLEAGMREAGAGEALASGEPVGPAIEKWLGRGGGPGRPYRVEASAEAARVLLDAVSAS